MDILSELGIIAINHSDNSVLTFLKRKSAAPEVIRSFAPVTGINACMHHDSLVTRWQLIVDSR